MCDILEDFFGFILNSQHVIGWLSGKKLLCASVYVVNMSPTIRWRDELLVWTLEYYGSVCGYVRLISYCVPIINYIQLHCLCAILMTPCLSK